MFVAISGKRIMAKRSFGTFYRTHEARQLLAEHPTAFLLLSLIFQLADYRNGKARIGDYKAIGKKTTEQQYRTAKKILAEKGLVSFKGIPKKGTIATIISDKIFDINGINNRIKNRKENGNNNGNSNGNFEGKNTNINGNNNKKGNGNDNGNNNRNSTSVYNSDRTCSIPPINPPAGDAGEPAKKKKRFKKPTIDEIKEYCKSRNNGIDAELFFDHYETSGWKRGNTSIKDWKACVRTWENKNKVSGGGKGKSKLAGTWGKKQH